MTHDVPSAKGSNAPGVDPISAHNYLRSLDNTGRHGLVHFEPHPKNPKAVIPFGFEVNAAETSTYSGKPVGLMRVRDHVSSKSRFNQYYHVNEPAEDADYRAKCEDDDIGFIRAVFCDIDPDKTALAEEFSKERGRMAETAKRMWVLEPKPTVIVDSGAGLQVLWFLVDKVSVTKETHRQFDQIEHNLLSAIPEADKAVCDLSRILRLPGSVNVKRHGFERQSRVVFHGGPKYTLDQLLDAWPMVDLPAPASGSKGTGRSTRADELALISAISPDAPAGLGDGLASAPGLLGRLWRDGADALPEADRSGSACRWHLGRQMRRAGHDFNHFWHAARAWEASYGRNAWGPRDLARAWLDAARRDGAADGGASFEAVDEGEAVVADDIAAEVDAAFAGPEMTTAAPKAFRRGRIVLDRSTPLDAAEAVAQLLAVHHPERDDNVAVQGGRLITLGTFETIGTDGDGFHAIEEHHGLVEISAARLEQVVVGRSEWLAMNRDGEARPTRVPRECLDALRDPQFAGRLGFRPVIGLAEGPIVMGDGALTTAAGLDERTGLWVASDHRSLALLPDHPTKADALDALAELRRLLTGFAFSGETEDERSLNEVVALCGMMTAALRPVLDYAPLIALDAPTPGTGKSELTKLIAAFATSKPVPLAVTSNSEEFDKRLSTMILNRPVVAAFDNVSNTLGGDLLNSCLTAEVVQIRVFGKLEDRSVPARFLLVANGNNIRVRDDMCRRAIVCRLDTGMERPEQRTFDFDPVVEVRQNRAHFVRLVALILRAYRASGDTAKVMLAGFTRWADTCAAPLVWLGLPNPVRSQDMLSANDEERTLGAQLLAALHSVFGDVAFSASQLGDILLNGSCEGLGAVVAEDDDEVPTIDFEPLRSILREVVGASRGAASLVLGRVLSVRRGRPLGGYRLSRTEGKHRLAGGKGFAWRVVRLE